MWFDCAACDARHAVEGPHSLVLGTKQPNFDAEPLCARMVLGIQQRKYLTRELEGG
jgi:hypothetical protein